MALDYSKLSTEELEAIANNDYSRLSDRTLAAIAAEPETKKETTNVDINMAPQAASIGARMVEPVMGMAKGVGKMAAGSVEDAYKMGSILYKNMSPSVVGQFISSPITLGKEFASAYVEGHPWMSKLAQTTPQQAVQAGTGYAKNIGGRVLSGTLAPESAVMMPYQMAAYEQEKIRANPTAPGLEFNPYAQTVRGEAATQGRAGAANQMRTVANQPDGNVNAQERAILDEDRRRREMIRQRAYERVMGPVAPGQF